MRKARLLTCAALMGLAWAAGPPATFEEAARAAAAARERNDLAGAAEDYRRATALKPEWQEGWWWLGSMAYDANRYADAVKALEKLVQLNPQAGPPLALLGLSEFETRAYDAALDHLTRALAAGMTGQAQMEGVVRFHLAESLAHAGRFDDALQQYGWFVAKGVRHDALLTALGDAALHEREMGAELKPERQALLLAAGRATFLSMSGAAAEARQAFAALAQTYGRAPFVHYLSGIALAGTDAEAAVREFRKELEVCPDNGADQAMLALFLLDQDRTTEALPLAAAAAKNDPAPALSQYVYGRALAETGDVSAGIAHLQEAVAKAPATQVHHVALAAALAKAGRPEEARRERVLALSLSK